MFARRVRFLESTSAVAVVALCCSTFQSAIAAKSAKQDKNSLILHARRQVETATGSGRFHSVTETIRWNPRQTAIVVCDMWDKHWCQGATRRVGEMAPRMNEVLKKARAQGVLIIHCPSGTMDYYQDTPQRKLAELAPKLETKIPLERWCHLDADREGALPIDDKDGGCDCSPTCKTGKAWSRQIGALEIEDGDVITDSAEAYYLMRQRKIDNLIVMGVHTNMCVLGRPFSIRQMVYQGQNVVLMRDLTDTMYNSRSAPFVSHFTGTDLVVEHIERNWCPTIASVDFVGGEELQFQNDRRPHLVIVMAEQEYKTNETLPPFAMKELGKAFKVSLVHADEKERNILPGVEVVKDADVLLISVRRRVLPKEQMAVIRQHIEAGKPVIGIRTANHAFSLRGKEAPEGLVAWETFDADVIGGHYTGHHGNGPKVSVTVAEDAEKHRILEGVDVKQLIGNGSLYQVSPLATSAKPLLIGTIADKSAEPIAWTNTTKYGGAAFYTSLGHPDDFQEPAFRALLKNAIEWATQSNKATAGVTGRVSLNGQPIENAVVTFHPIEPTSNYPAVGLTDADGFFKLTTFEAGDGALVGEHIVTISKKSPDDKKQLLPQPYPDPKVSPLHFKVREGENEINLELQQ